MNKRAPALLLAISLLLTVPALAAPDSTENFVRGKTYTGQFSDLTSDSVFYDNVARHNQRALNLACRNDVVYGYDQTLAKTSACNDELSVGGECVCGVD